MARDYTGRQTSDKKTLDLASKVSLLVLGIIFLLAAIITPLVVFMSRTSHGTVSYGDFIYQYNIENGNVYYDIKKYIGQGTENVIIPSEYNGAPVVGILENAFNGNTSNIHRNIKKITFDTSGYGGISRIDEGAFVGLASLTEFTLPSQIEIIAEGAFEDCVISGDFVVSDLGSFFENTNGIIGDYVSISTGAFDNCSVGGKLIVENATGGIVPGEVLNAFGGLNATEVELSPNVNIFNLGTSSFASFRALETLTIYTCANEVGSNYYTADNFDMANCTNLKNLNVLFGSEEKVDYHLTQKFVQSPLENVYFGEGVTELGAKTFDDFDNLKQITVNNNVVTNSQGEIVEIKGFAVDRNIMPDEEYRTKGIRIYFENEDQGILNNLKINYDRTLVPNPSNSGYSSTINQEFMSIFTKDKIRTLTIGADIEAMEDQSLVGLFGGRLSEGEGFGLNFEVRGDGDISAMRTISQSLFSTIPSENVRIVRNVDVTGPRTDGGDNGIIYQEFNTADGTYRNRKSYNGNLDWGDSVYKITFDLNMSNENFDGFSPSLSIINIPNVENNDYITMPIDNNNAGNEYALVGFIQNGNGSGGGSGTTYRVSQLTVVDGQFQLLFRASEWNVETDEDERTRLVTIYCMWEKKVYHNVTYVPQFSDTTISLSQIHPEYYTYFISYTEGRVAENSTYGTGAIIINETQNSEFVGGMPEIYQSGFMFTGWNTQSDGSGQDVGVDTVCTGELTLYGQWEEISYNIIYHATTKDFTSASQATYTETLTYNDAIIMLTGTNIASVYHIDGFYIMGYNFIGWTTSETLTGTSLDFELDSIFDEWGESSNKLTSDLLFNLFGEEYYFDQNVINFESPMFNARDVHLYGMYSEAEYTLDYVLGDLSNPADFESQTLLYGGEITLERGLQIERTGYTFTGYGVRRDDGSVTGALFNLVNNGEENVVPVLSTELLVAKYGLANAGELKYEHCCDQPIEIVAIWSANVVEVTFNANGGSGQEQISYAYDQAAPLSDGTAFTRAGYSLIGWAINSTQTTPTFNLYTDGNITTVTGQQLLKARFNLSQDQDLTFEQGLTNALTLYAVWEQHIYNLSVDFGDGTAPYEFGEVTFGGSYGAISQDEINSHTNPGFVFAGIYSEANGGGTQIWTATGEPAQDTFNASFASSGDQTVYAFWTLTNYSLNFNVNTKIGGDDISTQALGNTMSILLKENPFSSGDAIELEDSLTLTFTPAQGFVFSGLYAIIGGSSLDNLGAQDVVSELISEPYNIDITAQFLHDYLYNNSVNLVALFIAKEFNVEFVLENTDNVVTDWGTLGNPGYSYLYNEEGNPDSGIRGITSTVVFSKPFSYVKYLSDGEVVYGEQPWPSITLSNAYFNNWIIKIGSAEQIINAESEVLANILTNIDELEHGATITLYARCSNYEAYNITITTPSDYPDAYSGYTITQDFAEGGSSTTNGSATEIVGVRRGATVTLTLSVNAGYIITDATSDDCHIDDFKLDSTKQNVTLQLVMPTNNVEINLFARPVSGTVSFKVYHYAENLDGSYSQLSPILTEDKEFVFNEGTTDFTVAVADYVLTDATYNGTGGMFEFNYGSASFGGAGATRVEISTDGTSEIHIFYKRMIHSLTINVLRNDQAAGGIVTNLSANPPLTSLDGGRTFASANIKYGQSVAISQVDIVVGYKFVNYTLESGNITFAAKDLTQTLTMGTQDSILNLNITESMLTLTLNANGAEFNELDTGEWQVSTDPGSGSQIATKQVAYGSTLYFLPIGNEIVKTGFTFVGWFTNADGGGTQYTSSSTMPSTALTLYAYFKATEYRVTINKTDASHFSNISATGTGVRIDGTQSNIFVEYGSSVTLNITMADGCYIDSATFNNPSLSVSGLTKTKNVKITFTYTLAQDSTLNLASVMVTYNITFLSNGGILNGTNSNIDLPGLAYNNTQTISGTITSAQYNHGILSGWQVSYNGSDGDFEDYTSDNLPKPNLNESDLSLSNNAHIYLKAIWRTHSYTLEFTLPSGLSENVATLSASSTTIEYGNQYTLRDLVILNLFGANNAAFTMQGWKTYVNGELKEGAYIDEVDFVSGNSNANSTVVLNLEEIDPWYAGLGNIADGDTITLEADIIVTTVNINLNMIFMGTDGNYENSQTAGTLTVNNHTVNVGLTLNKIINNYIDSTKSHVSSSVFTTFTINRRGGGTETVSFAGFTLDTIRTNESNPLNTIIGYQGEQEQNYTIYFARNTYAVNIYLAPSDDWIYVFPDRLDGRYVTNSSGGYFALTYLEGYIDSFVIYYNDTATIHALTRTGFNLTNIRVMGSSSAFPSGGYALTINDSFIYNYLENVSTITIEFVWEIIPITVRFDVLDGTFNDASADPSATSLSVLQSEYGFVRVTTNLYYSETLDLYYHYGSSDNDRYFYRIIPQGTKIGGKTDFLPTPVKGYDGSFLGWYLGHEDVTIPIVSDGSVINPEGGALNVQSYYLDPEGMYDDPVDAIRDGTLTGDSYSSASIYFNSGGDGGLTGNTYNGEGAIDVTAGGDNTHDGASYEVSYISFETNGTITGSLTVYVTWSNGITAGNIDSSYTSGTYWSDPFRVYIDGRYAIYNFDTGAVVSSGDYLYELSGNKFFGGTNQSNISTNQNDGSKQVASFTLPAGKYIVYHYAFGTGFYQRTDASLSFPIASESGGYDSETNYTQGVGDMQNADNTANTDITLDAIYKNGSVTFNANPTGIDLINFNFNATERNVSGYTYVRPVTAMQPIGELPMPTATGYAFAGWYTEPTGGTQITPNTLAQYGNMNVYGRWTSAVTVRVYYPTFTSSYGIAGYELLKEIAFTDFDYTLSVGDLRITNSSMPKFLGQTFQNDYSATTSNWFISTGADGSGARMYLNSGGIDVSAETYADYYEDENCTILPVYALYDTVDVYTIRFYSIASNSQDGTYFPYTHADSPVEYSFQVNYGDTVRTAKTYLNNDIMNNTVEIPPLPTLDESTCLFRINTGNPWVYLTASGNTNIHTVEDVNDSSRTGYFSESTTIPYSSDQTIYVYLNCAERYMVNFLNQRGVAIGYSVIAGIGSTITLPTEAQFDTTMTDFLGTGYRLSGWAVDNSYTVTDSDPAGYYNIGYQTDYNEFNDSFELTSNIVSLSNTQQINLRPVYAREYTLEFNPNSGYFVEASSSSVLRYSGYACGDSNLPNPGVARDGGYEFLGWEYRQSGTAYGDELVITGNVYGTNTIPIRATWGIVYEVVYYTKGSNGSYSVYQRHTFYDTGYHQVISNYGIAGTTPSGEAGHASGWATEPNQSGSQFTAGAYLRASDAVFNNGRTVNLYAVYVEDPTVVFMTFDGTDILDSVTLIAGETVGSLPTAPSRVNFTFVGWSTDQGAEKPNFGANTPVYSDTTVFAIYRLTSSIHIVTVVNPDNIGGVPEGPHPVSSIGTTQLSFSGVRPDSLYSMVTISATGGTLNTTRIYYNSSNTTVTLSNITGDCTLTISQVTATYDYTVIADVPDNQYISGTISSYDYGYSQSISVGLSNATFTDVYWGTDVSANLSYFSGNTVYSLYAQRIGNAITYNGDGTANINLGSATTSEPQGFATTPGGGDWVLYGSLQEAFNAVGGSQTIRMYSGSGEVNIGSGSISIMAMRDISVTVAMSDGASVNISKRNNNNYNVSVTANVSLSSRGGSINVSGASSVIVNPQAQGGFVSGGATLRVNAGTTARVTVNGPWEKDPNYGDNFYRYTG